MSLLQTPWTQQPTQVVGVDRSHPIGGRIVYASRVSDGCFDQVKNRFPVGVSATRPTQSVSNLGPAAEFVPASSNYYSITTATNLISGSTLTVSCWARIDSITAGGCLYSLNGTGYSAILGLLSSAFLINQNSAASTNVVDATTIGTGWHHIVCVHRSNTYSLYVDGVLRGQSAAGNYWGQPAAGNHSIGNRLNGSSPQYFDGAIQDLYVIQGELTEPEAKSLYQNHWQVYKPLQRRIFVPVAAATGDATGTGTLSALSLIVPTASATGSALSTGSFAAISLGTVTGSASAGTSATATGSFAPSSLSAPSASATGSALATGTLTAVSLSSVTGTASGTTAGNAEGVGSVATIALTAPSASASASALATGTFSALSLSAPTGTASNATNVTATGDIQAISILAPLAIAIGSAVATGGIQTIGLTAPVGHATGETPLTDSEKIDLILDILSNRQTLDPVTGTYTLYADDGVTVLKTALAWEDAAGTQPYRGQALQRLDPLE